ncbi:MAG: DMT family transporter [Clostridia bacterium]|nr:DMT family transporter [Clostridia bacterium]MBR6641452.1 DMT family transporter [Clostridia bacterium]
MTNWILLTVLYAVINGIFQCAKKKSIEKNSIFEVLAVFSLIAFLISAIMMKDSILIHFKYLLVILFKSSIIVIAWVLALNALKRMEISLYGVINLSRIIFSVLLSVLILGEKLTISIVAGIILVITGLVLVNKIGENKKEKETDKKAIFMLLGSCFLNATSAIIDKGITTKVTSSQLQFYFLLFLTIIYWIILLFKQKKVDFKSMNKNYWVLIAALSLVLGDKFLFIANEIPDSKVAIMTLVKQLSVIEVIILGRVLFKEENIVKKLLCSLLVILGILLTVI